MFGKIWGGHFRGYMTRRTKVLPDLLVEEDPYYPLATRRYTIESFEYMTGRAWINPDTGNEMNRIYYDRWSCSWARLENTSRPSSPCHESAISLDRRAEERKDSGVST